MHDLDMNAKKFVLDSRPLTLREKKAVETLVRAHPSFDGLHFSGSWRTFVVRLRDQTCWEAGTPTMSQQIARFLESRGIKFHPETVIAHSVAA